MAYTWNWRFLKKLQTELSSDAATPLQGIHLEKSIISKDTCSPMFIASLFPIARPWKQPRCPLTEIDKETLFLSKASLANYGLWVKSRLLSVLYSPAKNVSSFLNVWKIIKRNVCEARKLYKVQISISIGKVFLQHIYKKYIKSYWFPNAISNRLKSIEPGEEGSWVFVLLKLPSDYVTQAEN